MAWISLGNGKVRCEACGEEFSPGRGSCGCTPQDTSAPPHAELAPKAPDADVDPAAVGYLTRDGVRRRVAERAAHMEHSDYERVEIDRVKEWRQLCQFLDASLKDEEQAAEIRQLREELEQIQEQLRGAHGSAQRADVEPEDDPPGGPNPN